MQLPKALTRNPYDKAKCGGHGVVKGDIMAGLNGRIDGDELRPRTFCPVELVTMALDPSQM